MLNPEHVEAYHRDGYVFYHSLLDTEEIELLRQASKSDDSLREHILNRGDGEGGVTKLALWNDAGGDILGLAARSERIVDTAEQLLGEEVYHWHTKMIQKEAYSGGAWAWHQDYGYWYNDHVLYPRMLSCYIAIDEATRENGCLQVLKGSHHIGRIDHGPVGDQTGADPIRVDAACQRCDVVYCELKPGDALFFHCNLLHRSDQNRSPHPRWALICCYNAASNSPIADTWQPSYNAIEKIPHAQLKAAGPAPKAQRHYLHR